MAAPEKTLRILPFPQSFTDGALELRVVLVPTQALLYEQDGFPSQEHPGGTVSLPRFIKADPFLDVTIDPRPRWLSVRGPDDTEGRRERDDDEEARAPPAGAARALRRPGDAVRGGADGARDRRRAAAGRRRDPQIPAALLSPGLQLHARAHASRQDRRRYHCAVRRSPESDPTFRQSTDALTWGNVIAFCLRQPLLAERMGLLHRVTLDEPGDLEGRRLGLCEPRVADPPSSAFPVAPRSSAMRHASRRSRPRDRSSPRCCSR